MTTARTTFDASGYLLLSGILSLSARRDLCAACKSAWSHDRAAGLIDQWAPFTVDGRPLPSGCDPLERLPAGPVLRLIGQPRVLSAVRAIAGADALPSLVWTLQKNGGDGHLIRWHQDTVEDRNQRVLTVGYHLDAMAPSETLTIVPGTQHAAQDMDALEAALADGSRATERLSVGAGDVLIHDAMLVHASAPRREPGARLTLYAEFRSAAPILAGERGMEEWVEARQDLLTLAERLCAEGRDPRDRESEIVARAVARVRHPGMRNQSFRPMAEGHPSFFRSA